MTNNNQITESQTTKKQSESEMRAEEARIKVQKIYTKGQQFIMNGLPDELSKN